MNIHLLREIITHLEVFRASMRYTELFGPSHGKLESQKEIERIINQAKQELAVMEASQ